MQNTCLPCPIAWPMTSSSWASSLHFYPKFSVLGAIRRIDPGEAFIHALFHLERPTVTIVVRSGATDLPFPQYAYLRPGLGWNNNWEDRSWFRRLQSIHSSLRLDPTGSRRMVRDLVVDGATLWEAFLIVEYWCRTHGWDDFAGDLVDGLASRNESMSRLLAPAFAQEVRTRRILTRRGMLHSLHHRTLLALLANLPDAESITATLQQLFPGQEPTALLLDWVEELSAPGVRGVSGLSLSEQRLNELRTQPLDGLESELLTEIRTAWGEPTHSTGRPV